MTIQQLLLILRARYKVLLFALLATVATTVAVSVWLPKATVPLPDSVVIDAPALVLEISNVPLSLTPLDVAMLPLPDSARVPDEIVVAPV